MTTSSTNALHIAGQSHASTGTLPVSSMRSSYIYEFTNRFIYDKIDYNNYDTIKGKVVY